MTRYSLDGQFHLGTHLCREPMPPMSELKRDMETLRRNGFTLIKLQEHWDADEPAEGAYDFSTYEELIEYAAGLDLSVYLGLTCEQAPRWLYEKYPDCRMVGSDGYPINYAASTTLPADGKPGPCFDHPGAADAQRAFITALVRALGRYENIAVWNTWQEIGYWSERLVGKKVCYCAHTIEHFRSWLKRKYGNIDGLNRAWNTRFADWRSVFPDQLSTRRNATPHAVEFSHFMANVQIARVLRARAEAIRDADPFNRPVFAHKSGPEAASGVDWTYARCQDFLGTSAYPAWGTFDTWDDDHPGPEERVARHTALACEMWSNVAMRLDHIRSCNVPGAPVWAAEFQGGPVSNGFYTGRVPSPDDIRRWMLTSLASGATTISFWVTRAEIMANEANGFGLLDSSGDITDRFREASRIGTAVSRYEDLFGSANADEAPVGILVDEPNYRLAGCLSDAKQHLVYSTRGWYRMFWERGVPVDFVDSTTIRENARTYRLLVLPFPLSVGDEVFRELRRYVDDGGHVVSEAAPGRLTPYGYAVRGELSPLAAELFGVRQDGLGMMPEPDERRRWMPAEATWGDRCEWEPFIGTGELDGIVVSPALYAECYVPVDAAEAFRCGGRVSGASRATAAGGGALLVGTLVGHQGTAYRSHAKGDLVGRLLDWAGVTEQLFNPLVPPRPQVLVRRRAGTDREAWFFTNPEAEPVKLSVDVKGFSRVSDLLGGEVRSEGETVHLTVGGLDVRVLVVDR